MCHVIYLKGPLIKKKKKKLPKVDLGRGRGLKIASSFLVPALSKAEANYFHLAGVMTFLLNRLQITDGEQQKSSEF